MVTINAASFSEGWRVIIGVFVGARLVVIKRPVMILPQANRLRGLIRRGVFSLIGESAFVRGKFMQTKKITRRL